MLLNKKRVKMYAGTLGRDIRVSKEYLERLDYIVREKIRNSRGRLPRSLKTLKASELL